MSKLTSFPGGMLLGAGLMYFFDPVRGTRRRRRVNEAVTHAERVERQLLGKAARDARHRVHGLAERAKHPTSPDAPDTVIEERVRARLGRAVSHPGAIDVACVAGRVILRGHVLAGEANDVVRAVRKVVGVREIVDRVERHGSAESIPSLQGEGRSRKRGANWTPALQVAATGAGVALAAWGLLVRRGLVGTLAGAAGGLLLLRATYNRPVPELIGPHAGVTIHKTVSVGKPIHEVFDLWSRFENFSLFMEHVREVEVLAGSRSRWIVDGPAGTKLEFEAETTELEPDRVIGWRTMPDQPIEHEGRVRFEELPYGTRVTVEMTYRPPGGIVGHAIAHLLGWDPKSRLDEDLVRMKTLLEEGKTRAHRQTVELADLH